MAMKWVLIPAFVCDVDIAWLLDEGGDDAEREIVSTISCRNVGIRE